MYLVKLEGYWEKTYKEFIRLTAGNENAENPERLQKTQQSGKMGGGQLPFE